jgi:hypothetical protein
VAQLLKLQEAAGASLAAAMAVCETAWLKGKHMAAAAVLHMFAA